MKLLDILTRINTGVLIGPACASNITPEVEGQGHTFEARIACTDYPILSGMAKTVLVKRAVFLSPL